MSIAIYPEFDSDLRGAEFKASGQDLAYNVEALDRLASAAGQKPFTAFGDTREIPDDFDGPPEDLEDILGSWTEWFDPAEGRTAIQALVNHIKANPTAAETLKEPAGVLQELEDLARVLAVAEKEGIKFRLQMS